MGFLCTVRGIHCLYSVVTLIRLDPEPPLYPAPIIALNPLNQDEVSENCLFSDPGRHCLYNSATPICFCFSFFFFFFTFEPYPISLSHLL